jgi:alpha-1,2-mannosyltransferase
MTTTLWRKWFAMLRSGDWLDRERLVGYSRIALIVEILGFLFIVAGTHGLIVKMDNPTTTDYVSFFAAGSLADAGTPQLVYDRAAHFAAEEQTVAPGIGYVFFYYPPVFLLICALIARLPYLVSYVLFQIVTMAGFLSVGRATLRSAGAILPLVAFPAAFWNFGIGQNAFLTAGLFGAALLLIDRRPLIAGILFGALCYKPHFGLLIPVALVAGNHWRAFVGAAIGASFLVAASVLAFGTITWQAFFAAAFGAPNIYESGRVAFTMMVSPFGGALLMGAPPAMAYAVQAVSTICAAILVAIVWRRKLSLETRCAALAAATLIAIPVVLAYDLMLAAIAALWLVRAGRTTGFLPWEKTGLVGLFLVPLVVRGVGTALHLPLGSIAALALVSLVAARAIHEARDRSRLSVGAEIACA